MSDLKYFNPLYVVKRNGQREIADFSKVDQRLNWLNSYPFQLSCNASFIAQKVRDEITDGIETKILDEHAAKVAADFAAYNPDFATLAMRIAVSNHQKNTSDCFSNCVELCYRNKKTNGTSTACQPEILQVCTTTQNSSKQNGCVRSRLLIYRFWIFGIAGSLLY